MTSGTLRTSEDEGTTSAGDLGIQIRDEHVDKLWSQGGEEGSFSTTFEVSIEWLPGDGFVRRRYGLLEVQGTTNGPVEVVEPKDRGEAFAGKVGDILKIRVMHG